MERNNKVKAKKRRMESGYDTEGSLSFYYTVSCMYMVLYDLIK